MYEIRVCKQPAGATTHATDMSIDTALFVKVDPDAVLPCKAHLDDVGLDVTVIRFHSRLTSTTVMYDTGLQLRAPPGMHAELIARSSMVKHGLALANAVGVIDPGYTGNLLVALTKTDPHMPDPVLPLRCCQLVFRRTLHVRPVQVERFEEATERGVGGFGSTDAVRRL